MATGTASRVGLDGDDGADDGRRPLRGRTEEPGEEVLLEQLRRGDEAAFAALVRAHHASLVRVAKGYVRDAEAAEEVAQETWLAVIRGLDRFEGRSSLKTWIFRIVVNRAKSRGVRDRRAPQLLDAVPEPGARAASVDPDRFLPPDDARFPGHWAPAPRAFPDVAHDPVLAREVRERLREAIDALAPRQRTVIVLRDVEGLSAQEVCGILHVSEANQRVLLHRARSAVRAALERYLLETPSRPGRRGPAA